MFAFRVGLFLVMGLVMVVGLGDNSGADAGWYPGKYVGRVIVNGVHRRQDRRAARRSCGGAEVQVQAVAVQYSDCGRSVPVEVPAPAAITTKAPAPITTSAPEMTPEEERSLRDRIAEFRGQLKLMEDMIEMRKFARQ